MMLDANCEQKLQEDCGSLQQAHFQSKSKGHIQEFMSEASTGQRTCHTALSIQNFLPLTPPTAVLSSLQNFRDACFQSGTQKSPKIFATKLSN